MRLPFYETKISRRPTGESAWVHALDMPSADRQKWPRRPWAQISADLGNRIVPLVPHVARQLYAFNQNPDQRRRLGHDCVVFAYACNAKTSVTLEDFSKSKTLYRSEYEVDSGLLIDRPDYRPGGVWMLTNLPHLPNDDNYNLSGEDGAHLIVGASADPTQPLYASKFQPSGPAVLHSFEAAVQFYNSQSVAVIDRLRIETGSQAVA